MTPSDAMRRTPPRCTNHQPIAPHAPELSAVDGIKGE